VIAVACSRRVLDLSGTLQAAMVGEHERAAGAWHAEWEALGDTLALTGGAVGATREALEGLRVDADRMRDNLGATGGLLLSEHVTTILAQSLGRLQAHELVEAAAHRTLETGRSLREELLAEPALREILSPEEVDAALDPARYLGSAEEFVDRALELYRGEGLR
jgi:3-carboxy-cis,cis-muconate cycloisomerase